MPAMRALSALKSLTQRTVRRVLRDTRGATAVEYGLIIAVIVLVMVVGLTALAKPTVAMWNMIDAEVAKAR